MKIKTNNNPRVILYWHELSDKEKQEFDYEDAQNSSFVRYKNWVYDIGAFHKCSEELSSSGWSGCTSDSAFSGVLLRFVDSDSVVMGTFLS